MNNILEMINLQNLNLITSLLLIVAVIPVISGLFMRFSRESVLGSLWSLLDNISFIFGIFLSFYLTRRIFFDHQGDLFQQIYYCIPLDIRTILYGKDILIYLSAGTLILLLLLVITRPLFTLIYRILLSPLADVLYSLLSRGGPVLRCLTGAVVRIPSAVFSILVVGLALNFLVYYFPLPILSQSMNSSALYQVLYQEALCPVLNSNLAKQIPVIVNDAFAQTLEQEDSVSISPENSDDNPSSSAQVRVIEYFNGVTLDEAVQSNAQIDQTAAQLVSSALDNRNKAYLLYEWISKNIEYDYDKAAKLAYDPSGINSGSIVAFTEREGVCFDYSSLYVSMCRAVGLQVRLLTGQAYSGMTWGDHAWNQVYMPEEDRWINVDATFGSSGNYFDKTDFAADHRYAVLQGEW